jgi:hypothetical protein
VLANNEQRQIDLKSPFISNIFGSQHTSLLLTGKGSVLEQLAS